MRLRYAAIPVAVLMVQALLAWSADPPASKRDDSASEKLGMKLSLQCWTYNRLTFVETVDKAAGLGIKYLESYPGQKLKPGSKVTMEVNMSEETAAEVKKKLADAGGIKLVAFGVFTLPTDEPGARKVFAVGQEDGHRSSCDRGHSERGHRQAHQRIQHQGGPAQPPELLAARRRLEGLQGQGQADRRLCRRRPLDACQLCARRYSQEAGGAGFCTCT